MPTLNEIADFAPLCQVLGVIRSDWIKNIKSNTIVECYSTLPWSAMYSKNKTKKWYIYNLGTDFFARLDFKNTLTRIEPYTEKLKVDLITFWDGIISKYTRKDFKENILPGLLDLIKARHIALSIPIFPGGSKRNWPHAQSGYYRHFYTSRSLEMLLSEFNYTLVKFGYSECPPLVDFGIFLFKNNRWHSHGE